MKVPHAVIVLLGFLASAALAGARIDLRLDPPISPTGYQPNELVNLDVYMVDTGNPQGDIPFSMLALDFTTMSPLLRFPGPDGVRQTEDDDQFTWVIPFGIASAFPHLPYTSWWMPFEPSPLFSITLPNEGEVRLGGIVLMMPDAPGLYQIDVMNSENPSPDLGAKARFGIGGLDDPITYWRAYTGELTGGTLDLPVVPEPGSLFGILAVLSATVLKKRCW